MALNHEKLNAKLRVGRKDLAKEEEWRKRAPKRRPGFSQNPLRVPVLRALKSYTGTVSFLLSLKTQAETGFLLTDKQVAAAARILGLDPRASAPQNKL